MLNIIVIWQCRRALPVSTEMQDIVKGSENERIKVEVSKRAGSKMFCDPVL